MIRHVGTTWILAPGLATDPREDFGAVALLELYHRERIHAFNVAYYGAAVTAPNSREELDRWSDDGGAIERIRP